jgi:hypothetical protein
MKRILATLVAVVVVLGGWGVFAAFAKPAPVYQVDSCVIGGSTTVSWANFHAQRVDFFWFDTATGTQIGMTSVTGGKEVKSPLTVSTFPGADHLSVEWWTGGPGGPNTRYGIPSYDCT